MINPNVVRTISIVVMLLVANFALAQERPISDRKTEIKTDLTQPLFVVDGLKKSKAEFYLVNPGDIAKMEVIQANDASLLYGAEGKNGAVILTTKKFQKERSDQPR
jgi:hypothetical protein